MIFLRCKADMSYSKAYPLFLYPAAPICSILATSFSVSYQQDGVPSLQRKTPALKYFIQ